MAKTRFQRLAPSFLWGARKPLKPSPKLWYLKNREGAHSQNTEVTAAGAQSLEESSPALGNPGLGPGW